MTDQADTVNRMDTKQPRWRKHMNNNTHLKENTMTMTKKTVEFRTTVSGIRYWTHWTITANLDIEFEQNPNTGLWQHKATHVGVEDGSITAVHDTPNAYPVLKFSNGSGFKTVDWARKNAEIGMDLGDKDDWIDAVYSDTAVADAVNALRDSLNSKENTND